jgi:hypothetical protein
MAEVTLQDRWRAQARLLRPDAEIAAELYIEPARGAGEYVASMLLADVGTPQRVLLIGPRGGGKTTELLATGRRLVSTGESPVFVCPVWLSRLGVNPATVSAADLLYLSAMALLSRHPDRESKEVARLGKAVHGAYAPGQKRPDEWRRAVDALDAVAAFAAALTAANPAALSPATTAWLARGISAGLGALGRVALFRAEGLVDAESPEGRNLLEAAAAVQDEVVKALGRKPVVLVDGLERLNGSAGARFAAIFHHTRLLAESPWAAVYSAPPCTVSSAEVAETLGYLTRGVWGFAGQLDVLARALRRRFDAAAPLGFGVADPELCAMSERSGGLPRHAVEIAQYAAERAFRDGRAHIDPADAEAASARRARELSTGLDSEHITLLRAVQRLPSRLPAGEKFAELFARGAVLVEPPDELDWQLRYRVHPLLLKSDWFESPPDG